MAFLPAATTIVYELGLQDALVCVTHECEFPPAAKTKPKLLKPALDSNAMCAEAIDAAVKQSIKDGAPLYEVVVAPIIAAGGADVALVQELCDVCAAGGKLVASALSTLPEGITKPRLVELTAHNLDGLYADIKNTANACGVPERGIELVTALKRRVGAVRSLVSELPPVRVTCLEWLDPLYNAGHWVPDVVASAGGTDPLAKAGVYSTGMTYEAFVQSQPEAIILMPCGFDVERTERDAREQLATKPGWGDIPAVKAGRVWAVNGFRLLSGASPALVDAVEILARILHPRAFMQPCHGQSADPAAPADGTEGQPLPSPAQVEALLRQAGFGEADVRHFPY